MGDRMKIINTGNNYDIYDDSVKTFDSLPVQPYVVKFSEKRGFWLEKFSDIEIKEKVYGVHQSKVDKVMNSFKQFERNLGVILSGEKGIGKSLFAKMLSKKCIEEGYPLIIVTQYYQGIAAYLDSIEQEAMVLFDEFDKTFGEVKPEDGNSTPQTELLTLFDGISQGKKLFVISCNRLRNISDFLVNRPGRFHYHFRFDYPDVNEIKEYLTDKLEEQYRGEIDKVIPFSKKVPLNYDCLRAIAFELSSGIPFDEAIKDLNIVNMNEECYSLRLVYEDGHIFKRDDVHIDLFDMDAYVNTWITDTKGNSIYIRFEIADTKWDSERMATVVEGKNISVEEDDDDPEAFKELKGITPQYLIISRHRERMLHYAV